MIKVAVCDDNSIFCDDFVRYLRYRYPAEIESIEQFPGGEQLLQYISRNNIVFDFVFLDYKMRGLNGIDTGRILRENPAYRHSMIFFITSYNTNPEPVVDIHPFAYLKKPLQYEVFNQKFLKALSLYQDQNCYITLTTKTRILRLPVREILYFQSGYRNTSIFTTEEQLTINLPLRNVETILNEKYPIFVRINNSTIINLLYLFDSGIDYVMLNDTAKTQLKLTRTYHTLFLKKCAEVLLH